MSRPNDARALRSRQALGDAFLELLGTRPFEQITIREITAAAGVSYPVFFRRYAGKDELWADIAAGEVRNLLDYTGRAGGSDGRALCDYVQGRRSLWEKLLATGAASVMRAEFIRIASELAAQRPRANPWLPVDLASAFVASGIFEILSWWLKQPDGGPSPERVARFIDVLVIRATTRPLAPDEAMPPG